MTGRSSLKWLHRISFFLILSFFLVEPGEGRSDPGGALSPHVGIGQLLAPAMLVWLLMYLHEGSANRLGSKFPGWTRRPHTAMHAVLRHRVPVMVASGAVTGLTAPFLNRAFGIVPMNFGFGSKTQYGFLDALRIIAPKPLHKYL